MYAIHIVDIPYEGDYTRQVTMCNSFTLAEALTSRKISALLDNAKITLVLECDNIYDVFNYDEFIGYCVINTIEFDPESN